jgi:hypothetical protein
MDTELAQASSNQLICQLHRDILNSFPVEILTQILQLVCSEILGWMDGTIDLNGKSPKTYKATQQVYFNLHLVCRSFHSILDNHVRIHGTPVHQKFIDHQITRFGLLLNLEASGVSMSCLKTGWLEIGFTGIGNYCGSVWLNPRIGEFAERLLGLEVDTIGLLKDSFRVWFWYHAPHIWAHHIKERAENAPNIEIKVHPHWREDDVLTFKAGRYIFDPKFALWGDLHGFSLDMYHARPSRGPSLDYHRSESEASLYPSGRCWLWFLDNLGDDDRRGRGASICIWKFCIVDYETGQVYDSGYYRWGDASVKGLLDLYPC